MSIDKCIQDALKHLSCQQFHGGLHNTSLDEKECEVYVWPQTWSDASCGDKGGFSAQAITTAPTVVILGPMQDACVYHRGQFAYKINQIHEKFWTNLDNRDMPSKEQYERERENVNV